jgi:putative transposase
MTNYRRNFLSGGSFFFTVNLAERRRRLLTTHIDLLRRAFRDVRRRHPFDIQAIVVLPDHLHAVWTLPEDDSDFALRWRLIKTIFSHGLPVDEGVSASRAGKGERGLWQRRYWEHTLRDDGDLARHVDYIHILAWPARRRGCLSEPCRQRRARPLAAALLGAHAPR